MTLLKVTPKGTTEEAMKTDLVHCGLPLDAARGGSSTLTTFKPNVGVGVCCDGRAQDLAWMRDRLRKGAEADEVPADASR